MFKILNISMHIIKWHNTLNTILIISMLIPFIFHGDENGYPLYVMRKMPSTAVVVRIIIY